MENVPKSEELKLDTPAQESQTILVIDDDSRFLNLMHDVLRNEGYVALKALTGEDGIQLYKDSLPDLVFLDLAMPGMDGLQVLEAILNYDGNAKIVVITGYGTVELAVTAMQEGAIDFVEKLDYATNFREVMFKKIRMIFDEINSGKNS